MRPQLATLVDAAPDGEGWLHEMKYDGYRILCRLDGGRARLLSRQGNDRTSHFPAVARAASELPGRQALLDGEVAVMLPEGTTSFQALQNLLSGAGRGELAYFAFDLLHLDGTDLTHAPLEERKELLGRLLTGAPPPIRYSDHVVGEGARFYAEACRRGLEGIISKRRDAPYREGRGREGLDYLRNHRGASAVAPYSTRARPEGPVSVPLSWEELAPELRSDTFTIANLAERLRLSDPWSGYWRARQRLTKKRLQALGIG